MTKQRLLLVGGSVRAAAMSARRAGFEPLALDRFADADLRRVCPRFERYDELGQLPELSGRMPVADWMYTGPLENNPRLVERLGRQRQLLGNGGAVLDQLRDPWCVAAAFESAGLRFPALLPELRKALFRPTATASLSGTGVGDGWLRKPLRGAGGFGISRVPLAAEHPAATADYFQKFIAGRPIGATFVGADGRAILIGVTEQLLGPAWGGAREFQYVGSVGPIVLAPDNAQALTRVGDCIAANFPVQGLFGVDAIVNDGGVWPVEVNPRYTASVEVLERAFRVAAIQWHVAACRHGELPDVAYEDLLENRVGRHGKGVVYATRDFIVDQRLAREFRARIHQPLEPEIADIPPEGTSISRGEPIVTVFAKGMAEIDVQADLLAAMTDMKRLLTS